MTSSKCSAYFSLKVSFSCSLHMFITCRSLYTFMGSSINPFMLMNLMRCCSASNSMGGMTASCRICFSVFWQTQCHTQKPSGVSGLLLRMKLSDNMVLLLTCTVWNLLWLYILFWSVEEFRRQERKFRVSCWLSRLRHVPCAIFPVTLQFTT